ncbi:MAG: NCS2 family permease [Nitrospirae bacterium]|nr:NCS2 family permease [Nitrospirota bacterium]MDA1303118.1 NCS2 family permease [Nitrospirota bacterium]
MLEKYFHLSARGTTVHTELLGGTTTFFTLSYIIFVQPTLLSATGMDFGAVMVATCVASAFATLIMGLYANFPIAMAPAMGHNFFFTFTVCGAISAGGMGLPWQTALGAVFVAGVLFLVLSRVGLRTHLLNAVPSSLKHAIAVGIGLLISFIGFQWAGIVVDRPGILIGLGDLTSPPTLLALTGLAITSILLSLGYRAAILLGILVTSGLGLPFGLVTFSGIASTPPSLTPTFFQLDFVGLFSQAGVTAILIFFFLAVFDTIGTVIGISTQAGLVQNGHLPHGEKALTADATGITLGAVMGTSTLTCFVESAAGVASGARTGLANIATAGWFLLALFFFPLVQMVSKGYVTPEGLQLNPVIAPTLIVIGSFMLNSIGEISWKDPTEAIPAFLTMLLMPLTVSIADGIAFGIISYCLLKLATGRGAEVPWLMYGFGSALLLGYFWLS